MADAILKINNQNNANENEGHNKPTLKIHSRADFYKFLENALNQKSSDNIKGAVMIINIDEFKLVNDSEGHIFGDLLLKEIGKNIQKAAEDSFVSSLGGDEFGVIINNTDDQDIISLSAEKILNEIKNTKLLNKDDIKLSASIGIAVYTSNSVNSELIIKNADIALYKAKENGKNRFEFFNSSIEKEVRFKRKMKNDLKNALKNNEIEVYYQPQYSTSENKIIGLEALMRWQNESYLKIPIQNTIKFAEKEGLIDIIGKWVFKEACIFAKKINKSKKEKTIISINISPIQVMKENFVDEIVKIIKETKVNPSYLGIEITETVFMENFEENCKKIQFLKDMGIAILLDDFGTGFSSLSYLLKLPISIIKIDKSFLNEIETSVRQKDFIKSIIEISHDLNLEVIVEGVETNKQYEILTKMNCDCLQGFYLAKPMPQSEICNSL